MLQKAVRPRVPSGHTAGEIFTWYNGREIVIHMKKHRIGKICILTLALTGHFMLTNSGFAEDPLTKAKRVRVDGQQEAQVSQKKIDSLAAETQQRLEEYRGVLHQLEQIKDYNDHVERLIGEQNEQLAAVERQINNARETQRQIVPLINRMVAVLEELVNIDMPFLIKERRMRVQSLKKIIDDPNIALPDKYRRVMEAYQIEMDFGRNIEAYTAELSRDNQTRMVEFLRVGRVALLYMTFDGGETGYWDKAAGRWVVLDRSFNAAVARGLQVAKKRVPPELIKVPVAAPE